MGKSTLVNALLKQKIAAVSPKPQTTRKRQLGILTSDNYQLVFVDTPGMHNPRHKLGKYLNQEAEEALQGVDVVLWADHPDTQKTADFSRQWTGDREGVRFVRGFEMRYGFMPWGLP